MKGRYVATLTQVARLLPCRYQTLLEYRKMPDFPEDHSPGKARYDVAAIRQFIYSLKSAHNWGGRHQRVNGMNQREALLAEKKQVEIERDRFKLELDRGKYWLKEEGKSLIAHYTGMMWSELDKAFVHELPARNDGLNAVEVAKAHRDRLRVIRSSVDKILASA